MIMVLKINVHRVLIICLQLLTLLTAKLYAQELPVEELNPVEVYAQRLSPFAVGAQTTLFDSALIVLDASPSMADLITNYTSNAVKSYGNGMLSTISLRGTGPSHTAVLWHGINIAYPMLGQSDLSLLSLALSNTVKIQRGTGSALYGSGALGGTISLSNSNPLTGINLSVSQWVGSYGSIKNMFRASYANEIFFITIKTLWDQSENNFKFENSTKPGLPTEEQEGAAYKLFGTSLESGIDFGKYSSLRLSVQYFNADRNLQPSMNANFPADNQTDENNRIRVSYYDDHGKTKWNLSYAYLHDVIGFNGDKTYASQQVVRAEFTKSLFSWMNFNLAGDYNFIQITSPFYVAEKTNESRNNLWASFLVNPQERLVVSLNLRQSFNPGYTIPFTPSLGAEYLLVNTNDYQFKLNTQVAKGFRVPTLNERFWQPGGNPDLIPEESYSVEFGMHGKVVKDIGFSYELTGYRMWVENWILWRPQGSFWSPENIKYVDIYGIEAAGSLRHRLGNASQKWMANYAYTKSINRTGLDQFDRSVNKQLAYIPIHRASLTTITQWRHWSFVLNTAFTGERFITADNEEKLPGYTLINIRVGKTFGIGNYLFNGQIKANNILNTKYQSIENKAMPGANILIGITISYHKP